MDKIINSPGQLKSVISKLKKKDKKIIHCHGVFDLIHLGHIHHFREAKSLGGILIVSITANEFVNKGPSKPLFHHFKRAEFLSSLNYIDYITINYSESSEKLLKIIKPDIYCKGPDYKKNKTDLTKKIFREKKAVENGGGKIYYTKDQTYSSSNLINKSFNLLTINQKKSLNLIKKNFDFEKIEIILKNISNLKALVIGETIIDEYNFCEAIGKSGKEPVMVLKDIKTEKYLGGVLSIARNVATFCKKVNVVSVLGENNGYKEFIKKNIEKNVIFDFISKKNSPTIIKKRYVDNISKNKILGVYKLNDKQIEKNEENKILNLLKNIKKRFDLIIVSDFGHGMMTKKVIKALTKKGVFVAANSQLNSSNKGYHDLNKYSGVDCIVINESELRYELRDRDNSIESLMKKVKKKLKIKNLIVTKGSAGAVMLDKKEKLFYAEAFAKKVIDKVGSGDTLMAITSLFLQKKIDPNLALLAGSLAAANSVENIGNKPIKKIDIIKSLEYLLK